MTSIRVVSITELPRLWCEAASASLTANVKGQQSKCGAEWSYPEEIEPQ